MKLYIHCNDPGTKTKDSYKQSAKVHSLYRPYYYNEFRIEGSKHCNTPSKCSFTHHNMPNKLIAGEISEQVYKSIYYKIKTQINILNTATDKK